MNPFKSAIIVVLIILAVLSIYAGAYKPLVQARMYISAQAHLPTYHTFKDFRLSFDRVFNFPSPIGKEEISKFANSQFESMVMDKNQSEAGALAVTEYAESHIFEDNIVHLLQIGNMYRTLYMRFGRQEYLNKTEDYYQKIVKIGPELPHGLYALLYIYEQSGQDEKMKETAQKIFELWPEDDRIKKVIDVN